MQDYQDTPHRAKKDRKRWCKGRVGTPHEPGVWAAHTSRRNWWEKRCPRCQKILDYWIGFYKEEPPDDLKALMDAQPPMSPVL